VVVLTTVTLLATGVALIVVGPGRGLVLNLHKASFVVWVAALGAHVLGHLGRLQGALLGELSGRDPLGGSRWRLLLVAAAVAIGAIAAVAVYPQAATWLHWMQADHADG
jgi:hypothetical protein